MDSGLLFEYEVEKFQWRIRLKNMLINCDVLLLLLVIIAIFMFALLPRVTPLPLLWSFGGACLIFVIYIWFLRPSLESKCCCSPADEEISIQQQTLAKQQQRNSNAKFIHICEQNGPRLEGNRPKI